MFIAKSLMCDRDIGKLLRPLQYLEVLGELEVMQEPGSETPGFCMYACSVLAVGIL